MDTQPGIGFICAYTGTEQQTQQPCQTGVIRFGHELLFNNLPQSEALLFLATVILDAQIHQQFDHLGFAFIT